MIKRHFSLTKALKHQVCCVVLLASLITTNPSVAEEIGKVSQNGVTASLVQTSRGVLVSIAGAEGATPSVFTIANPTRVVVDLPGVKIERNNTLTVSNSSAISGVRLGCHQEKTRIVIDVASAEAPEVRHEIKGRNILIMLEFGNAAAPKPTEASGVPASEDETATSTVAPTPTAKPAKSVPPPATPTVVPSPSKGKDRPSSTTPPTATVTATAAAPASRTVAPSLKKTESQTTPTTAASPATTTPGKVTPGKVVTPVPSPTALRTVAPAATASPSATKIPASKSTVAATAVPAPSVVPAAASGESQISGISFDYEPDTRAPLIAIALSERAKFALSKASDRNYRLTISDVQLAGAHLALPLFPPEDFNGFTVVRAQQAGPNVEILIGIERGNKITPTIKDNTILIRGAPKLALRPGTK